MPTTASAHEEFLFDHKQAEVARILQVLRQSEVLIVATPPSPAPNKDTVLRTHCSDCFKDDAWGLYMLNTSLHEVLGTEHSPDGVAPVGALLKEICPPEYQEDVLHK